MDNRTQDLPEATLHLEGQDFVIKVRVADSFISRARGLAGRKVVPRSNFALWLKRTRSVHTFFMKFSLDLVWLDKRGVIIRIDRDVPPRRVIACRVASSVIELAAGSASRLPLVNGLRLTA